MKIHFPLFAAAIFTLSACSAFGGLLDSEETPAPAEAVATATPVASPAPDDAWCQRAAASDRRRAQDAGYDAATLDRMTLTAYQQCRALGSN